MPGDPPHPRGIRRSAGAGAERPDRARQALDLLQHEAGGAVVVARRRRRAGGQQPRRLRAQRVHRGRQVRQRARGHSRAQLLWRRTQEIFHPQARSHLTAALTMRC